MIRALLLASSLLATSTSDASVYAVPADCAKYFGDACSPAIGAWLPRLPSTPAWAVQTTAAATRVHDEIIDPAGRGPVAFGSLHGILGGTRFTYGTAGPPRGSVVYDPVTRSAMYDVGCCAWHDVVVAADVSPPPKRVIRRSLAAIHTSHEISLGIPPGAVRAVFGPAPLVAVPHHADEVLLAYRGTLAIDGVSAQCDESYAFLFRRGRLALIDYGAAC
jgi:hypothetical protein